MEKQIREYEKFIAQKVAQEMSEAERMKLADLHRETVANFQHERIIHLMVTLFFCAVCSFDSVCFDVGVFRL